LPRRQALVSLRFFNDALVELGIDFGRGHRVPFTPVRRYAGFYCKRDEAVEKGIAAGCELPVSVGQSRFGELELAARCSLLPVF
jgi:hypothetical protein